MEIPSEYLGKPVTAIGYRAFFNQTNLTHVTAPNSVKIIESEAFSGCNNIVEITLPFIGESLDYEVNSSLAYVFGATSFSDSSVIPASLKSVTVTGGSRIGNYAFAGCNGLTSITIPDSVKTIGDFAFSSCSGLTSIAIPNSVNSIGNHAFDGCGGLTSIAIPNGVKTIGGYAFSSCSGLTTIAIPDGVNSIGDYAFSSCSDLTSITIPDSVVYLGNGAFERCQKLKCESFEGNLKYIGNVLIGVATTLNSSITLKPTTTIIYDYALINCKNLTSIVIPESVKMIGAYAFSGCSGLTSITIPDSVKTLDDYAFSGCENLTTIVLGSGVTIINPCAFASCDLISDVYYRGVDEVAWLKIAITASNQNLIKANRYYYSETENTDGKHWRYVNNVPTVWQV